MHQCITPANLSFGTRLVPAPSVIAFVRRAPMLSVTETDFPSRQMRSRRIKAAKRIAIDSAKTKYMIAGVLMFQSTSRCAVPVRAISKREIAPMMSIGMTMPAGLARNFVPVGFDAGDFIEAVPFLVSRRLD